MYIEFGMAQKYIDDLSKNVTRGLQAKVDQGWLPGVAPLGYLNNRTPAQGARNIIKDPERFPLVRKMWDLMLTGNYTPPQILEMANHEWHFRTRPMRKLGGKPLSRSAIYKIFTNPFYFGLFEYNGQLHQGRHEPMVTAEEFDRVQTLLGRDGRPRRQKHLFAYTGLIRCGECGCAITAENKQKVNKGDGRVHQYTYYRCSKKSRTVKCSQSYIEVRTLERQIDVYLQRIEISEAFKDWAIKYVHEANDQEVAFRKEALATQRRSYDACLKRLDNLMNLKLSPDNTNGTLLSDQEFGEQKSKLVAEKVRLEEKLRDTEQRVEQWLEITEKTFVFACYAREWFAKSDLEKKRQILTVVGSNLVLKDKKLFIEAPKPFFVLEKGLEGKRGEMERFEPPENGSVEPRNEDFNDKNQLWCALVDDVRTSVAQIKDFIDPIECLINSCKISNISQIHSMRS